MTVRTSKELPEGYLLGAEAGKAAERKYLMQYVESEITVAKQWLKENQSRCTDEDKIRNSAVIDAYENLYKTIKTHLYPDAGNK